MFTGYRSIDSIEHLSDEDDLNSSKLNIRFISIIFDCVTI